MMNRKMVKVICIIMAALMLLSVGAVVLQVFAVDEAAQAQTVVLPDTGDGLSDYVLPAGVAGVAVLAVILCLVVPKLRKEDTEEPEDETAE